MPRYKRTKPRGWYCDYCGLFYPAPDGRAQVQACEARHKAFQQYADGVLDELGLAQFLGYDLSTPRAQEIAVQRIRDMIPDSETGETTRPMMVSQRSDGYLVNVTMMHSNGRIQIPHQIRKALGLEDGMPVYWYDREGLYYISPSEMKADWWRGKSSVKY